MSLGTNYSLCVPAGVWEQQGHWSRAAVGDNWEKLVEGEVSFQSRLQLLDGFSALFTFATRW